MSDDTFKPSLDPAAVAEASRARIQTLIADCAAAIDNDQLELWPGYFTERCIYRVISRSEFDKGRPVGFIFCDSRAMLIDRVRATRSANVFQPHGYRHVLGPSRILGQSDGRFEVETSFIVIRTAIPDGTMIVFSAGRYLDRIVLDDRSAKFESRIAITDSDSIDMLLVLPI
jgi:anthranilate 1,2-dioxygenase small subunit